MYKPNENETNFDDAIASYLSDSTVSHDLDFPVTCKEVRNGLSKLKLNKGEGFDIISTEMLKYGALIITHPFVTVKLFNYMLNSTVFPEIWSVSFIATIYEKGDKNDYNNDRGISRSSCLSKLFTGFNSECKPVLIENIGINCLSYADDLLLLPETEKELQQSIDILEQYCNRWKLEVNLDKTKVMIFNTRQKILNTDIKYDNPLIEQVYNYQYVGVNISSTGNPKQASVDLSAKTTKVLFSPKQKIRV